MKVAFLAVLGIVLIDGALVKKENSLPAPNIKQTTTFDPAGIKIEWDPVKGRDEDPVTGYRMKVWELSEKIYSYEDVDGKRQLVEKIVPIKDRFDFDYNKWTKEVGPETTEAEVNDVTFDIFYELRVQALTKNEEGPFSDLVRVSVQGPEDKKKKIIKSHELLGPLSGHESSFY